MNLVAYQRLREIRAEQDKVMSWLVKAYMNDQPLAQLQQAVEQLEVLAAMEQDAIAVAFGQNFLPIVQAIAMSPN